MTRFMRHASWTDALFLHYAVDAEQLQRRLPAGLVVDTFNGVAYVGVVALTESGIVPLPPGVPLSFVRCLGLSHEAVNVRTYVRPADGDGPPGIYFFTLDCNGLLPTIGAFLLFNLPYKLASMRRAEHSISSQRVGSAVAVQTQWEPLPEPDAPADDDQLGRFFVERYALYCTPGPLLRMFMSADSRLWCGTITHAPWPLRRARLRAFGGICSSVGVLTAVGLSELVLADGGGGPIAHASSGVGPIEFFWRGGVACP